MRLRFDGVDVAAEGAVAGADGLERNLWADFLVEAAHRIKGCHDLNAARFFTRSPERLDRDSCSRVAHERGGGWCPFRCRSIKPVMLKKRC